MVEVATVSVTNLHWYYLCVYATFQLLMLAWVGMKIEEDYFWVLRASPLD